ncbi:hypothetical protein J3R82DRAFT_8944 [Butyriboletus roseoflavus]|nr:hypothetical protein J3R82DRAFT_8944 [Butyriboletus roseoflavus]
MPENSDDTTCLIDGIPGQPTKLWISRPITLTVEETRRWIQHSKVISDTAVSDRQEDDQVGNAPTPVSFHQDRLEDWSESLFSVIGGKGKRSSVLLGSNAASVRKERRSTVRPMSPLSMTGGSGSASTIASNFLSPETMAPSLRDLDPPASTSSLPSESLRRASIDSLLPLPLPKPRPKPTPLALPPALTLAPPIVTGIYGIPRQLTFLVRKHNHYRSYSSITDPRATLPGATKASPTTYITIATFETSTIST